MEANVWCPLKIKTLNCILQQAAEVENKKQFWLRIKDGESIKH